MSIDAFVITAVSTYVSQMHDVFNMRYQWTRCTTLEYFVCAMFL